MFKHFYAAFLIVSLILSSPLYAQSKEESAALLSEILGKIETIEGKFVQFTLDQRGIQVQQGFGDFKAAKPNRFFWRTQEPLAQEIYVDGKEVTVYDPDLEQATIQTLDEQLQSTPAMLLSGESESIAKNYFIEKQPQEAGVEQFLLFPIQPDSLFEKMRVRFENGVLSHMRISDSLGQDTTVSFQDVQINAEIPESAFKASFPEDTDIIQDLPAVPMPADS